MRKQTIFVHVDGWVGVWEKGVTLIDVYRAVDAARPGMAEEMITALREGRNHPDQVDVINVSQDLNRRGSPREYLGHTGFVEAALAEWAEEFGHLHCAPHQVTAAAA